MNDMSLKQLYKADWASEAAASSSDEDKEQIRDSGPGEQEGGGGTPCFVHGTIGGTPCSVHGTTLGLGGTPEQQAKSAAVKEASDRLDGVLAFEAGSEAGEDTAISLAPGSKNKKAQWCDADDDGLDELVVPATTTTAKKQKNKKQKNKAACSRRWPEDRDAAMLELAVEVGDSLMAGGLKLDDLSEAVRRGGSGLGLMEAEARAVAVFAISAQLPTR